MGAAGLPDRDTASVSVVGTPGFAQSWRHLWQTSHACYRVVLDTKLADHQPYPPMNFLNRYADPVYCLMRLVAGLLLAQHGGQLVLGMFGGMPGSDNMMMQLGGWIQLVGGLMIAFGLLTRLAAFICSGMF